jgi:hypothetical protein
MYIESKRKEMINMNEKLCEVLERFEREDGSLQQINDDGEYMTETIEKVFEEAGFNSTDYDVTSCVVFSSPSADFGYVSVAWIEDGKLHHQTYEFE